VAIDAGWRAWSTETPSGARRTRRALGQAGEERRVGRRDEIGRRLSADHDHGARAWEARSRARGRGHDVTG